MHLKFTGDATVVSCISSNEETKYRKEIESSVALCQDDFSLGVSKPKELVIDFMKKDEVHT